MLDYSGRVSAELIALFRAEGQNCLPESFSSDRIKVFDRKTLTTSRPRELKREPLITMKQPVNRRAAVLNVPP